MAKQMTRWRHNPVVRFLVWPYAVWYCAPTWVKVLLPIGVISVALAGYYGEGVTCGTGGVHPYSGE